MVVAGNERAFIVVILDYSNACRISRFVLIEMILCISNNGCFVAFCTTNRIDAEYGRNSR